MTDDPADPTPEPNPTPDPAETAALSDETRPMQSERLPRLGAFSIEEKIGEGGMGVVYRAYDPDLQRTVAIKRIHPRLSGDDGLAERFVSEARAIAAVAHPNIAQIHAIHAREESTTPFFVMEYVEGESADTRVRRIGKLSVTEAVDITTQAARGLRAAQQRGIVHGDVKPSNLVITGRGLVKLVDFGLSRPLCDFGGTAGATAVGTPHYVSPEQSRGHAIDHRSDIYSLGCTLFYLLCARPPFDGSDERSVLTAHLEESPPDLNSIRSDVPAPLTKVIEQMLAKSPSARHQNYEDLLDELSSSIRAEESEAARDTASPPVKSTSWLRTVTWILLWSCSLTLAAIVALSKSEELSRWVGGRAGADSIGRAILEDIVTDDASGGQRLTYSFGEAIHSSIRYPHSTTKLHRTNQEAVSPPQILGPQEKIYWQNYDELVSFPYFERLTELELVGLSFRGTPDFEIQLGFDPDRGADFTRIAVRVDDNSDAPSARSDSSAVGARLVHSVGGDVAREELGAIDARDFRIVTGRRYVVRVTRLGDASDNGSAMAAKFLLYIAQLNNEDLETPVFKTEFSVPSEAAGSGYASIRVSGQVNSDPWGLSLEKALLRGHVDYRRIARDVKTRGVSH